MTTRAIRTHLTFEFDPAKCSEQSIKDRLDQILCDEFDDVDVHTRWYSNLADAPLFGAALQVALKAKRDEAKVAD